MGSCKCYTNKSSQSTFTLYVSHDVCYEIYFKIDLLCNQFFCLSSINGNTLLSLTPTGWFPNQTLINTSVNENRNILFTIHYQGYIQRQLRGFYFYYVLFLEHEHILGRKKCTLNYSQVGRPALLFCTTRACKCVILRTEEDLPEATSALVWYQTYDPVYMLYCTMYLYCSFNYPAPLAFEVWSISFYLMPTETSPRVPGV